MYEKLRYFAGNDIIIPVNNYDGGEYNVSKCQRNCEKWKISERSVRNYCSHGKIPGAIIDGKSWKIPKNAVKPVRKKRNAMIPRDLLTRLTIEKESGISGGIYHKIQIDLTYNSNHIEGSRLSHDQTRYIFETNTIGIQNETINVDDIVETANHFKCIDLSLI